MKSHESKYGYVDTREIMHVCVHNGARVLKLENTDTV